MTNVSFLESFELGRPVRQGTTAVACIQGQLSQTVQR